MSFIVTSSHGFRQILETVNTAVFGETSESIQVMSACVPQAFILGPILVLLHVNNIPNYVSSSEMAAFADDTKVYKTINNQADEDYLQMDIDNLHTWPSTFGIPFNNKKSKVQIISRFKPYSVNNMQISNCDAQRDLRIWISSDLENHL